MNDKAINFIERDSLLIKKDQTLKLNLILNSILYMELNILTKLAIKASLQAGYKIMDIYNDPKSDFNIQTKTDNSPLTIADKNSNDIIIRFLVQSGFPILSEEEKELPYSERKDNKNLWTERTLRGTKELINGSGEVAVKNAVMEEGITVVGVNYVPVTRTLYFANKLIGSYKLCLEKDSDSEKMIKNNEPESIDLQALMDKAEELPVAHHRKRGSVVVVASRSHNNELTEEYISRLKEKYSDVEIVSSGSSIKICLVAEGVADIYPRFAPTMEWDTAAGQASAVFEGK